MEQLLNEVTPTWQKETSLPERLKGSACVAYNGNIYIFGGVQDTSAGGSTNRTYVFDNELGVWKPGKVLPKACAYCSAILHNDKAYIFGGNATADSVQIYNFQEDVFTAGAKVPNQKALAHTVVTLVGDKVYMFGGGLGLEVYIYDITQDTWSEGIPMPSKEGTIRKNMRTEAIGGKIYVMGGNISSPRITQKTIDIFDTKTQRWYTGEPMLYEAEGFGSVSASSKIYIVSGGFGSDELLPFASCFDSKLNRWFMLSRLPKGAREPATAIVGNKLYIIGGAYSSYTGGLSADVYSLEIDTSSDLPAPESLSVLLNTDEQVQLSVSQDLADNTELTWTSSVDSIATVDTNGKVTALTEGLTYINATNTDETFNESIPVWVFPGTADETRLAVHLTIGQKQKLYLVGDPSTVTWESVDESIATVDAVGRVTAVKSGLAIVKGWREGKEYQIYIRVSE